jgi:hypothetical protein
MNESSSVDAVEAYKEKLRSLRFGRVPGGNSTEKGIRAKPNPAWERGIKGEHRPDGSFMPYLNGDMDPIRMKDWGENRRVYEAELAKLRTQNNLSIQE